MASSNTQKTLLTVWTIWQFVEAALLITVGILTAVFASNSKYKMLVSIFIGVLIILDGIFRLCLYYTTKSSSAVALLVMGVLELSIGIYICILNEAIIDSFAEIVTIVLLVAGVALLPDGVIKARQQNHDVLLVVLEFILAIGLIALGITSAIMWGLNGDTSIILICVGIFLALLGVGLIVITIIKLRQGKKLITGSNATSKSIIKK